MVAILETKVCCYNHIMVADTTTSELVDLLPLAEGMTALLSGEDRMERLVQAVARALPCDAAALLRLEGDGLVPVAAVGLAADVFGRCFKRSLHPRLDIICSSPGPVRFPAESDLPDPYDGLVMGLESPLSGQVHACLGCPLRIEGELVGALTVDGLSAGQFDSVSDGFLKHLSALTAAAVRTHDLVNALERKADHQGLVARDLVQEVMHRRGGSLVGSSSVLKRLQSEIKLVGQSELPVLVTGETGVGKELVVRMLHADSLRASEPLVYVNCAALPESIVESELFGHARGAFTGAERERAGKFSVADGASLFLDEIGELPLHIQPKLLRVLQEGEVQRVGSDVLERVNVRVFAATNRDLQVEVEAGRFRADLLHRLDVCRIRAPALREHTEDIPHLAGYFADRGRNKLGTGPIRFSPASQDLLMAAEWPGNVRELENVILRATLRAAARTLPGDVVVIEGPDLDLHSGSGAGASQSTLEPAPAGQSLRDSVREFQRSQIRAAVQRQGGNWAGAARELGLGRANLHHLAQRLGLK